MSDNLVRFECPKHGLIVEAVPFAWAKCPKCGRWIAWEKGVCKYAREDAHGRMPEKPSRTDP